MLVKKTRIPLKSLLLVGLLPSGIKKLFYRLKGYKIGKKVRIGFGSIIIGKSVVLGDNVQIGYATMIRAKSIALYDHVNIGSMTILDTERIEIGEDTRIREQVYAGGLVLPESFLKIGKRCLIMQMSFLNPTKPIMIDDDTAIGGNSSVFTHSSWLSVLEGYPAKFEPVTIGKKVWIPWNSFITSGVSIGDNVVIAPGIVVSRNIPSNSMANGNPLKIYPNIFKRENSFDKKIAKLNEISSEFCEYLTYNGYTVNLIKEKKINIIEVLSKNKKTNVVLIDKFEDLPMKYHNDDLIVLFDDPIPINEKIKMLISIKNNERVGYSEVGEEYVRYLSRYGIRFERKERKVK